MTDELKSKLNDVKYYNQQGKNYKVAALLQELMEDYPDSDAVRFQYALYLAKGDTNDVNSAIKILRNLIDENRKNKLAAIYEYIKVCIYNRRELDTLEKYIEELIDKDYKRKESEFYYGKYCERIRDLDRAKIHYEKAKELGYMKAESSLAKLSLKSHPISRVNENVNNICNKEACSFDDMEIKIKILSREKKMDELYNTIKKTEQLLRQGKYINNGNIYLIFKSYIEISKIDEATKLYNKYKEYIKDEPSRKFYEARLDLCNGNFDDAIEKFKFVITSNSEYSHDSYYYLARIAYMNGEYDREKEYYDKMKTYKSGVCYTSLVYYYIRNNNREDAIKYLNMLDDNFIGANMAKYRMANVLLGLDVTEKDMRYYSTRQIINYDFEAAVEHIKEHQKVDEYNGYFRKDINIEELLIDVMTKIENMKPVFSELVDHYFINYDGIGINGDDKYNYIEVITVANTNKVITMYPTLSSNIFAPNYDKKKKEEFKTKVYKRQSQIDKFYKKYGK